MPSSPLHSAKHVSSGKPHPAHAHEGRERCLKRSVTQIELPFRLRGFTCLANSSTVILAGLEGCSRSRRCAGPLREGVCGGTQRLGRERSVCPSVSRSGQTLVSRGISAKCHNPAPAKRSRKAGESPYPSSHTTRARCESAVSHDLLDQLGCQLMFGLCKGPGRESGSPATVSCDPPQTRTRADRDAGPVTSRPCDWHSLRIRPLGRYLSFRCFRTTGAPHLPSVPHAWES